MMGERASSKAEQVYEAVKEAILSGALEPGEPIDKLALCESLGVSRFPVSAALSRLAFERLVLVEPQHGSFVARISAQDVRERLFIRRAIEGEIAAEAARRLKNAGREALEENLREAAIAAELGDRPRFYALDVGFHAALTSSSRSRTQRRDSRRDQGASGTGAPIVDDAAGANAGDDRRTRRYRGGDSASATPTRPARRWRRICRK